MEITAFQLAQRFVGMKEVEGLHSNPQILAMLRLDQPWPTDDEVPWCSAFVNYITWLLRLPRSHSLAARSWLNVGLPINVLDGLPENDVVVLSRGANAPGPEVTQAPGHVGFFVGRGAGVVELLGGNQSNAVGTSIFPFDRILGVRRLA